MCVMAVRDSDRCVRMRVLVRMGMLMCVRRFVVVNMLLDAELRRRHTRSQHSLRRNRSMIDRQGSQRAPQFLDG
jgi:hypothetical protein